MKINLLAIILFFAFFHSNGNAQSFELGKVSIAELEEKEHSKDSSAAAAILFKKANVTFEYDQNSGFFVVTEVKTRIKIYKKEGYEWANQVVNYYVDSDSKENVSFSDVVTFNLVNGKIEKTKIKSDGEFVEKINKYWSRKKITMPNVKEGSVLEYRYTIRSPRYSSLSDWYFQSSIPVNYSEYNTYIPEYFTYNSNIKGFFSPKTIVEKKSNSIVLMSKEREQSRGVTHATFSSDKIDYLETHTKYLSENLPAIKEEAFVNNIDNYTSSISHELSMTKFPNTPLKYYSTDWKAVVKTIYNYDDFGPELDKTGYFDDDITKILNGLDAQNQRIEAIFNYVKSNVKWNNFTGYSCNDGVRTAYKNKTGNTAEINLMLTAMLRFAGLNANPVLISTRDNGIAFFPSRAAFNAVIAAVETPEGLILLDATEKYSQPNILPLRDLNWIGRLIRKDGTSTDVDLMPNTLSKEAINMNVILNNDGSTDGKIKRQLLDHDALSFRKEHLIKTNDAYLEELENDNHNIEISDYTRENDLDLSKPIVETYSFKDTKDFEIINDKIYISPLLFLASKENPFKQEEREYPVDFGYPMLNKCSISINIPEGYVVESMPASINISTGDGIGSYKFMIANSNNLIQLASTATISTAIVTPDSYPVLKGFFQQMIDKQNEKIVLKKI
ncbi:MAG TPA: transglutaminase domain-containing protein [Flavobacterium sp.]|nr:transglutaminase domain-containing protein [Flavobacterium sp.]